MQGLTAKCAIAIGVGVTMITVYGGALDDVRNPLEQWVAARKAIAKTRADWARDRETLLQATAMYERELTTLTEQISRVGTNSALLAEQHSKVVEEKARYQAGIEVARARIGAIETRMKQLARVFPPILRDTVQPLLNRLPADALTTNVAFVQRVQNLVTLLNEVEKFNATVTVTEETRADPDNRPVAVTVVYCGLGQGWFVDKTGSFAGFGTPGRGGWKWTVNNDIGPSIVAAIRMYRNELPAAFVKLPVQIQ